MCHDEARERQNAPLYRINKTDHYKNNPNRNIRVGATQRERENPNIETHTIPRAANQRNARKEKIKRQKVVWTETRISINSFQQNQKQKDEQIKYD